MDLTDLYIRVELAFAFVKRCAAKLSAKFCDQNNATTFLPLKRRKIYGNYCRNANRILSGDFTFLFSLLSSLLFCAFCLALVIFFRTLYQYGFVEVRAFRSVEILYDIDAFQHKEQYKVGYSGNGNRQNGIFDVYQRYKR